MKRLLIVLALAFVGAFASEAQAQHGAFGRGGFNRGFNRSFGRGFGRGFGVVRRPVFIQPIYQQAAFAPVCAPAFADPCSVHTMQAFAVPSYAGGGCFGGGAAFGASYGFGSGFGFRDRFINGRQFNFGRGFGRNRGFSFGF